MAESRSIKVSFDAKQKMTGLEIITGLNATNELGETAIKIVVWNIQVAAGPRSAEIRADIKSRPVVGRHEDRNWHCFRRHVGGMSDNAPTDCREHTNF